MSSQQTWDAAQYARNARFVSELGSPVVDLLAPVAGERILDLGCGDGVLSARIAAFGCDVIGIDASASMVDAARANGINATVGDGAQMSFRESFDAVFSNAALHWMKPPERVVDSVWCALRPGGRFVGEFGGNGNVRTLTRALQDAMARRGLADPDPWHFPSVEEYRAVLEAHGFLVETISSHARPTPLQAGIHAWLESFANVFLSVVPNGERLKMVQEIADEVAATLRQADGTWTADYVRLRFLARKPSIDS